MTFKCRFNATCFLFKINRFVLIFSKTSNRFVLKICSGGFADYTLGKTFVLPKKMSDGLISLRKQINMSPFKPSEKFPAYT